MSQDENLGDATEPPQVQLRRSNRERQPYKRYSTNEYVILTDDGEPKCFREAMESEEKRKWLDAMKFEACCEIVDLAVTST